MVLTQRHAWITSRADAIACSRMVREHGAASGLDVARADELAVVALELATNVFMHAEGGWVTWREIAPEGVGVELLAVDRGPGMVVRRAREDGFSTTGTAGLGLGAIERLSNTLEIDSEPTGTVVAARVTEGSHAGMHGHALGAAYRPHVAETTSGDGLSSWSLAPDHLRIAVIDGLGHGPRAAEASRAVIDVLRAHEGDPLERLVERSHEAARSTRGAAVAVAELRGRALSLVSIGNISCRIVDTTGPARGLPAQPGTLGAALPRRLRVMSETLPESGTVIFHTDGLTTKWTADELGHHEGSGPSLVAGTLLRDRGRDHDDATCVALRCLDGRGGADR